MRVTFFPNFAATTLRVEDLTLEQLQQKIVTTQARAKERLPWLKLAVFGDKRSENRCLRNNDNVVAMSGAELDYDGEVLTTYQIARMFETVGIVALVHTTPSSTTDKPRSRSLLPFSREVSPERRSEIVRWVMAKFPGVFANESATVSQAFFFGKVRGGPDVETIVSQGRHADLVFEDESDDGGSNPFEDYDFSSIFGMDVDAELAQMRYKSADHPIHNTQLRCVASLLSRGEDDEDVVEKVLRATERACVAAGQTWERWEPKERRAVEEMCSSWRKKLSSGERVGSAEVVNLDAARGKRSADNQAKSDKAKTKTKISKKQLHVHLAEIFLQNDRDRGGDLLRLDEGWWRYADGRWSSVSSRSGDEWIESEIGKLMKLADLTPTQKDVRETLAEVRRSTLRASVPWDAHGMIPLRNGMLDPKTHQVRPARADDYARRQLPVAYDAEARCPTWLAMLAERYSAEVVRVHQEALGAALLPKRSKDLRRALIQVGGSNRGKTSVLDVMCALLSTTTIVTPIEDVERSHGTTPFREKFAPWRLDEAFDTGKWHPTATVKAIISGEPFRVNIKNGPILMETWEGACLWATNTPVQFREQTRAIENRVIIVDNSTLFDPANPVGTAREALARGYDTPAALVIAEEMSGVLNWALEGMRAISERGYHVLPTEVVASHEEFREESNPLVSFFRECASFDPSSMVCVVDFHYAFVSYARDDMRITPSTKSLGRWIRALGDDRVGYDNTRGRINSRRFYVGIKLTDLGLDHWASRSGELSARGQSVPGASDSADDVNATIPVEWNDLDFIKRVRRSQRK